MKLAKLTHGLLIAGFCLFSGSAFAESAVWHAIQPGYYVEVSDDGMPDCSRPADTNWIYLGPTLRDEATLRDYYEMQGTIAHNLNGREQDYFIRNMLLAYDPFDGAGLHKIVSDLDGKLPFFLEATGLEKGGLDVSTQGSLTARIYLDVETGNLTIGTLKHTNYLNTEVFVKPVLATEDNPAPGGVWPDGTHVNTFAHCAVDDQTDADLTEIY